MNFIEGLTMMIPLGGIIAVVLMAGVFFSLWVVVQNIREHLDK